MAMVRVPTVTEISLAMVDMFLGSFNADRFYNMHIIVGDILKFLRDNGFLLDIHHIPEQIHTKTSFSVL